MSANLRVAIVGAGASGLTVARLLHGTHQVTIYEAAPRIGGHARTIEVPDREGRPTPVDTGVCMFYTTGYPNFVRLLKHLRVPTARCEATLELYAIASGRRYHVDLNAPWSTLASSLLSDEQSWLARDGFRFYQHALSLSRPGAASAQTLGEHLATEEYSEPFRLFLAFLCGSTWTLNQPGINAMPFEFVVRTMWELGFLPEFWPGAWHYIPGSVGRYLEALVAPLAGQVRLASAVEKVERSRTGVTVYSGGRGEDFDQVVLALPPPQALQLIADPDDLEREVLGAFPYQEHTIIYTADEALARSWTTTGHALFAASDVRDPADEAGRAFLFRTGFADLTRLCHYALARPLYMWYQFPEAQWPQHEYLRLRYAFPQFTRQCLQAQARHGEVSGPRRLHFCGTGWVNGIHEGAVRSALRVAQYFGRTLDALTAAG